MESETRQLAKQKGMKILKRDLITVTCSKGDKYQFRKWDVAFAFVNSFDPKAKDIISPCCGFGSDGSEEVTVKKCDCPIAREIGSREISKGWNSDETIEVSTCIYRSYFGGGVPRCEHYQGTMKVKRPDEKYGYIRDHYKVICTAQR